MSHDIKWLKDAEARMSGMQLAGGGPVKERSNREQFEHEYLGRFSCTEGQTQTIAKPIDFTTPFERSPKLHGLQSKAIQAIYDEIAKVFAQTHVEKNKAMKSVDPIEVVFTPGKGVITLPHPRNGERYIIQGAGGARRLETLGFIDYQAPLDPMELHDAELEALAEERALEEAHIAHEANRNDPRTATGIDLDYLGKQVNVDRGVITDPRSVYRGEIESDYEYRMRILAAKQYIEAKVRQYGKDPNYKYSFKGEHAQMPCIPKKLSCDCNSRDLFNFGCKCGYLKDRA